MSKLAKSELTLSVNDYNRPSVKEGADGDALTILRCIFKTRENPLGGNLAFNIGRYRFESIEDSAETLASDIKNHVQRVLPDLYIEDVQVIKLERNTFGIAISIQGKTENSSKKYLFKMQQDHQLKNKINISDIIKL